MNTDPLPSGREVVERVTTPTGEWQLQRRPAPSGAGRRGPDYEIICNGVFLMATYNHASDRQLATLALRRVEGQGLRVLVGGLGIGFTAQAVLEDPRVARLEIVEIEPLIGAWHKTHFGGLCGRPLEDPRTVLIQADLGELQLERSAYDVILLDTDNGPDWLMRHENARLYGRQGVRAFLDALTARGTVAYWAAAPSATFMQVLRSAGASVEEFEVPDAIAPDRMGTAWIYLAGEPLRGPQGRSNPHRSTEGIAEPVLSTVRPFELRANGVEGSPRSSQ